MTPRVLVVGRIAADSFARHIADGFRHCGCSTALTGWPMYGDDLPDDRPRALEMPGVMRSVDGSFAPSVSMLHVIDHFDAALGFRPSLLVVCLWDGMPRLTDLDRLTCEILFWHEDDLEAVLAQARQTRRGLTALADSVVLDRAASVAAAGGKPTKWLPYAVDPNVHCPEAKDPQILVLGDEALGLALHAQGTNHQIVLLDSASNSRVRLNLVRRAIAAVIGPDAPRVQAERLAFEVMACGGSCFALPDTISSTAADFLGIARVCSDVEKIACVIKDGTFATAERPNLLLGHTYRHRAESILRMYGWEPAAFPRL